jgi:ribonuclease P protein component
LPVTPSLKLSRSRILRGREAFREVREAGKRVAGKGLVLNYLNIAGSRRRVAFIVPKAVGNAVERNRIRRHLREIYRQMQERLEEGLISVWIVRRQAAGREQSDYAMEMETIYSKAAVLRDC